MLSFSRALHITTRRSFTVVAFSPVQYPAVFVGQILSLERVLLVEVGGEGKFVGAYFEAHQALHIGRGVVDAHNVALGDRVALERLAAKQTVTPAVGKFKRGLLKGV
jgi:hypothetical protein